jgi:hypothetical protein
MSVSILAAKDWSPEGPKEVVCELEDADIDVRYGRNEGFLSSQAFDRLLSHFPKSYGDAQFDIKVNGRVLHSCYIVENSSSDWHKFIFLD